MNTIEHYLDAWKSYLNMHRNILIINLIITLFGTHHESSTDKNHNLDSQQDPACITDLSASIAHVLYSKAQDWVQITNQAHKRFNINSTKVIQ